MSCILSVILAALITATPAPKADFAFKEVNDAGLELTDGGKPVFVYNFGMISSDVKGAVTRSCYLHPVYAPNGVLITDDFNPNHQHHRGISWMWQDITVDGRNGDIWTLKKGFQERFVRFKAQEANGPTAKLAVENGWFDGEKKFVKEDVEIIVHGVETNIGSMRRQLDFTVRIEAVDKPVRIVGTSEGNKGFGGFCFRLRPATAARRRRPSARTKAFPQRMKKWADIPGRKSPAHSTARRHGAASTISKAIPAFRKTAGYCGTASVL